MPVHFQNAFLVELDPPRVERGGLRVVGDRIAAVGDVQPHAGEEVVDCRDAVLMPGLVNGHTHLYSALAAGMPAPPRRPQNFHEILKFIWWRLDRAHNPETIEASGQVGALTALRCGTTTIVDHHASPAAIEHSLGHLRRGVERVGCRGVLCYETTDRNHAGEAERGLAENERFVRHCQQAGDGLYAGMIGAHASFTLSDESLVACVDAAKRTSTGVHIHVAEDPVDERITHKSIGCGLLDRFERHGLLDLPGLLLAHGTHLSESDIARLNERRETATLAHNPQSNMNNSVGYAPLSTMDVDVTLGTDGIGSDLWREARVAQFKSHDAKRPLPFGQPLRMLANSARLASRCLGVPLGSLAVGSAADLVLTDYVPATPLSADNLAGHVVYAMGPEYVRDVMIAGEWRLRDRVVVGCDELDIRSNGVRAAELLWRTMSSIPC